MSNMEMGVSYPIYLSFSLSPTLPYSDYKLVKALILAKSFTELLKSFIYRTYIYYLLVTHHAAFENSKIFYLAINFEEK